MRAEGAKPTILALGPTKAAELDTTLDKNERPIFETGAVGSSSPLYGLQVVELIEDRDPILIDPVLLGVAYTSLGTLLVDPYTGIKKNEVNVRLEFDALFHVRNAAGAYTIGKEALK